MGRLSHPGVENSWELGIVSRFDRFVRLHLSRPEVGLKLEFINDVPSRVGHVDVWGFCCQMNLSIGQAITGAHGKAAGIFPADLSRIFLSASKDDFDVILWINPPALQQYIQGLHKLGERLILV